MHSLEDLLKENDRLRTDNELLRKTFREEQDKNIRPEVINLLSVLLPIDWYYVLSQNSAEKIIKAMESLQRALEE